MHLFQRKRYDNIGVFNVCVINFKVCFYFSRDTFISPIHKQSNFYQIHTNNVTFLQIIQKLYYKLNDKIKINFQNHHRNYVNRTNR